MSGGHWTYQESKLDELGALQPNWDGYGSPPISDVSIAGAKSVIASSDSLGLPMPQVVPVNGGGVQMEWHLGRRHLEVEALPDGSAEYFTREGEQYSDDVRLASCRDGKLVDMMRWVAEGI